jgi:hypothetical protein
MALGKLAVLGEQTGAPAIAGTPWKQKPPIGGFCNNKWPVTGLLKDFQLWK